MTHLDAHLDDTTHDTDDRDTHMCEMCPLSQGDVCL